MRKLVLIFLVIAGSFLVGFGEQTSYTNKTLDIEIVEKYHLHLRHPSSTENITLPHQLNGQFWGLTQSELKNAGYDLSPFAGQTVSMTRYDIDEKYYQTALSETKSYDVNLWIFSKGPLIIGAYITNKSKNGPDPGIFAINDRNIKLPQDNK
jgi:hypothetical protein